MNDKHRFKNALNATLIYILILVFSVLGCKYFAFAARRPDDEAITIAIKKHLEDDEIVVSNFIDVKTEKGVVVLEGYVNTLLAARRAVEIAETIKGVLAVVDRLEVIPLSWPDAEIAKAISSLFKQSAALESRRIEITVADGDVDLTGHANSWAEKELAGKLARGTKGVKSVDNYIDLNMKADRSDSEITEDVQSRLYWDVWVDSEMISVLVEDGVVFLNGKTGSAREKRRATRLAWVAGVHSVKHDGLQVDWGLREEMRRNPGAFEIDDEDIENAIKRAIGYHPGVEPPLPEVYVEDGVATLMGSVDNLSVKNEVEKMVADTRGVWSVNNLLRIDTGIDPASRPMPEFTSRIAENARIALARDPIVHQYEITVDISDYRVRLIGAVDSESEKKRAEEVVSRVRGVVLVINDLIVGRERIPKEDWEIQRDVRWKLRWNPFLVEDSISVTVKDGTATLVGVVDSLRDRREAHENAMAAGALEVRNRLRVRNGPEYLRP